MDRRAANLVSDDFGDLEESSFEASGKVAVFRSAQSAGEWHHLVIDGQTAMEIRYAALGRTGGFGSIRVTARIGKTQWQTSLFPHRASGGFILLLKAEVRRLENIHEGSRVSVQLAV
jgi:hypothetical protein